MSNLYIYRSAAGAGKTYVLVKTYLSLALEAPDNFRAILAVTFTNQATQEMKHRILKSLYALAQGNTDTPLAAELMEAKLWTADTLQQQAALVLSHILHDYDHFNISTIDSFLQTIVRNFSRELGIQHGFTIEMDQEAVLSQIVAEVIQQAAKDAHLRQWLIHFAEHKLLSGKSWRVQQIIQQLGYSLFTEVFSQQAPALAAATSDPTVLTTFVEQLTTQLTWFESQLQVCGGQAMRIIADKGLTVADFAYGKQGVAGFLAGLAIKKNFVPTKRAYAAAGQIAAWYSKTAPRKAEVEALAQDQLQKLLQQAIDIYEQHHSIYDTGKAVEQLMYAFGVITHLLQALRKYRKDNNVLLISDTLNLLRQITACNEVPFVYEKAGTFYKHFLIDEFQDISTFQWQNLQPLIKHTLAARHMSLVVGDVKQSIYRWRGGEWQLLAHELEATFLDTQSVVLSYNWRSKPHIIKFNNAFFQQASRLVIEALQQEISQLTDASLREQLNQQLHALHAVYAHVAQEIPNSKADTTEQGHVAINRIPTQNSEGEALDWKQQVKESLPALLEQIQDAGFSLSDVAILVRNHAESREIYQLLLNHQHGVDAKPGYSYMALSDESLTLAQNPFVNILISALQYIANPEDQLAKTTLLYLYQVYVREQSATPQHAFWVQTLESEAPEAGAYPPLPKAFSTACKALNQLPIYEKVGEIIALLGLLTPSSAPFITAFQEVVFTYLQTITSRGKDTDFLTWWHDTKHKHLLPGIKGKDAVSMMTIHQAKGLEFKVVIIPFCNWSMDHTPTKGPILWCATETHPFATFPSLPLPYHPKLLDTIYAKDYYQERIQTHMDNVNLLYVAFTRATDRLYVFTPHTEKPQLDTTAELIQQAMVPVVSDTVSTWNL